MSANDGGPAFPITAEQSSNGISPMAGMSLRDYFAAHAPITLADAIENCGWSSIEKRYFNDAERVTLFAVMALLRSEYADAMISERERAK